MERGGAGIGGEVLVGGGERRLGVLQATTRIRRAEREVEMFVGPHRVRDWVQRGHGDCAVHNPSTGCDRVDSDVTSVGYGSFSTFVHRCSRDTEGTTPAPQSAGSDWL